MSALAALLSRFESPKHTGGQYLVRCPAHEDRKASLAIRETSDGTILLKCHAGCSKDAILAVLNLTDSDLFPPKAAKPDIVATYDYRSADGTLRYQAVRLAPKDFRQRRPDGAGWIWNLEGVDRVVYRLPELLGRETAFIVEGEKDADALWAQGIPATTNAGGAGKWIDAYTAQLAAAGLKRLAILPDNDPPGQAHADAVARSLMKAGLQARVVTLPGLPPKGDVSDFLKAGHSAQDILSAARQTAVWTPQTTLQPTRTLQLVTEGRYVLKVEPEGVILDLDRLHRTHHELVGELAVSVNGSCPDAKAIDGIISTADLNLSSAQARVTRAKLLADRSGNKALDWQGYLEELCVKVMRHLRDGLPAERFADYPDEVPDDPQEVLTVNGLPILRDHPTVIFADPGAAKSYLALWVGCELAKQFPVLYCDWELNFDAHKKRLRRLVHPSPPDFLYIRCAQPLLFEVDRIRRLIKAEGIKYLICDSIGPACAGRPEEAENANAYMREIRGLGIGSLHLAHTTKQDSQAAEEGKQNQRIFGSQFFTAGARAIWFMQRAENSPPGRIQFGLYHRKASFGEPLKPLAYSLIFEHDRARFERTEVAEVDDLAAKLPLLDRLKRELKDGARTPKALAEDLGVQANTIRGMVSRYKKVFTRIGDKISLLESTPEF